jgi:hypothetical protein
MKVMTRNLALSLTFVFSAMIFSGQASAQSGHFLDRNTQCSDVGTQLLCTGKVAGLGGTTFEITVEAEGQAIVECTNPGGNVAPGQTTDVTLAASTGPQPTPRNGAFRFSFTTLSPAAPPGSCPNESWTGTVVDVVFTSATLQLIEDGTVSDEQTVTVQ